ncbi:MAG: adenosine deaminase [Aestuariibacter sp.]
MIDPKIPLVDLHRHLDGNIHPHLIWKIAQRNGIKLPVDSLQELIPLTQIQDQTSDLLAFLEKLDYGVSVLANVEDCREVAYENMLDAKAQGIDYTELRFSPYYMSMNHNLNMADVVAAVADGVAAGSADTGVKVKLIGILSRTFGAETCMAELQSLLDNKDKITALDLAGDELNYPAPMFEEHFKKARDAGWHISVHAGEADGPESIWNAINLLGATRIGHAANAIHDQKLLDYMRDNHIAVESCPTSNYQTATIKDLTQHPLPIFLKNELLVCLNTDDPAVSNITLENEYRVAKEVIGLNDEQLRLVQENGVKAAFLNDSERQALYAAKR